MKKIIASLTLILVSLGVIMAQTGTPLATTTPAATVAPSQPAANPDLGDFKFVEETWDFGNTPLNKPVTHSFTFTNVGKAPIVISNCKASCGCTTPEWPKEPILPGKTGVIKVTYNAARTGTYSKSVTIVSDAKDNDKLVFIKGNIEDTPANQTTPDKQNGIVQPK